MAKNKAQTDDMDEQNDDSNDDDGKSANYNIGNLDVISGEDIEETYQEMDLEEAEEADDTDSDAKSNGSTSTADKDWALEELGSAPDLDGWDPSYD